VLSFVLFKIEGAFQNWVVTDLEPLRGGWATRLVIACVLKALRRSRWRQRPERNPKFRVNHLTLNHKAHFTAFL